MNFQQEIGVPFYAGSYFDVMSHRDGPALDRSFSATFSVQFKAVPEPGSAVLMLIGSLPVVAHVAGRRRKARAALRAAR